MSFRRTFGESDVRPVLWRPLAATGQSEALQQRSASASEVAEWQRQYAELQVKHQAELARVQQVAHEEGLRQGREEAASAIRDAAQKLAATMTDLASYKRKLRFQAELEVVRLSIAIARRILNRELATDPEALQGIVHAALFKLQGRELWQVRVSPRACEITRRYVEEAGLAASITVIADPALQTGDLLIETPSGELDASVGTQLQEIERGFTERLGLR